MTKLILTVLVSLILGLSAVLAQTDISTPPSATSPPPTSASSKRPPEPLSTTIPDNTRYLNKPQILEGCAARVAAFKGRECDMIFIGASITERWQTLGKAIWDKNYSKRNALDFGISGDKTQNVLWRLDNMDIKDLKPKVAVIQIGTNNTMNSPEEIAAGVKAVIAKTQDTFGGVKIILVSLFPNKRAYDKMMAADAIIQGYADNKSVYWLNLVPLMPAVTTTLPDGKTDTNWKGLGNDHLHPDASGYQTWADAMEPLVTKLLAGG